MAAHLFRTTNAGLDGAFVRNCLNKAKELLRSDKKHQLSMEDVAASCRVSSANHFSLILKKYQHGTNHIP